MQIESPYLNVPEAAAYLRRTVSAIYNLVKRNRLKPMPGSGRLYFTRERLDAFMNGKITRAK